PGRNSSTWMKLARDAYARETRICSSVTGPQSRLSHRSGVANTTTVGLPLRNAASSETACMWHGGVRVQICASPASLVATGVRTETAFVPGALSEVFATGTAPTPTALPELP